MYAGEVPLCRNVAGDGGVVAEIIAEPQTERVALETALAIDGPNGEWYTCEAQVAWRARLATLGMSATMEVEPAE